MGAVDLTVSVKIDQSLENDLQKEVGEIRAHFPKALKNVASEMTVNLQEHIQHDWYEPWGKPKQYKRRTDDSSLGTPLGSAENMHFEINGGALDFLYTPSGEHEKDKWSTTGGDDLIRIIQGNTGWKYPPGEDKQGRNIMKRPFWDNFVDDQVHHGIIDAFIAGMPKKYKIMVEGGESDVMLDGNEKLGE